MSKEFNNKNLKNLFLCAVLLAAIASACSKDSPQSDSSTGQTEASSQSESSDQVTLTLIAYDSFTPSENIFDEFTLETGVKVEIALGGDAGELVTKASLTAGNPQGDVLWGVDNTSLSRAIDAKIFSAYKTKNIDELDETALNMVAQNEVSPVDTGYVCINYDVRWFADRKIAPPLTLRALTSRFSVHARNNRRIWRIWVGRILAATQAKRFIGCRRMERGLLHRILRLIWQRR